MADLEGFEDEILQLRVVGDLLFTACADGVVRAHSLESKREKFTYKGHRDQVYSVAVNRDVTLLAAGCYNGEVRLWKIGSGELATAFVAAPGIQADLAK